jgi:hypothetical protein
MMREENPSGVTELFTSNKYIASATTQEKTILGVGDIDVQL